MQGDEKRPGAIVGRLPAGSSPTAKLILLYVGAVGGATIDEIQRDLRLSKLSIVSVVRALVERGALARSGDRVVTTSPPSSPSPSTSMSPSPSPPAY